MKQSLPYLFDRADNWYAEEIQRSYSHGVAHSKKQVEENQLNHVKWMNPLETRLPLAPDMKIYCFYGIGKPTERAYFYREDEYTNKATVTIGMYYSILVIQPSLLTNAADTRVSTRNSFVDHGVVMGEGDGTVNLLSSGYMCSKGWKIKRYNPAGIQVVAYEMPHEPDRFSPRGGPNTGDHVDILGRSSL